MQLKLYFNFPGTLTLPLGYNHILQGFIYETLRAEPEYSAFLHDLGYIEDKRPFKLFVYSQIDGKYNVTAPNISFSDSISFELRSPMNSFCDIFYLALMHRERYNLNGQEVFLSGCVSTKRTVSEDEVNVRTLSPICLSKTLMEDDAKKTLYISPGDSDFAEAFNKNFINKYQAAFGKAPDGMVQIAPVNVSERDKVVTKFAGKIFITAWGGIYKLKGAPEYLSFLYDAGLGAKNSQGFGMAERV